MVTIAKLSTLVALNLIVGLASIGNASAQKNSMVLAPAHDTVSVVPMATSGVSSAHYQAFVTLNCAGAPVCSAILPKVAVNHQLLATGVSCGLRTSEANTVYDGGSISVQNASNVLQASYLLPTVYSSPAGFHMISGAIDLLVATNMHLTIVVDTVTGTGMIGGCTVTGTMYTLG